jgi:hypothetical protein
LQGVVWCFQEHVIEYELRFGLGGRAAKGPGVQSAQCPQPAIETVDLSVLGVRSDGSWDRRDDHSIAAVFHDTQKCQQGGCGSTAKITSATSLWAAANSCFRRTCDAVVVSRGLGVSEPIVREHCICGQEQLAQDKVVSFASFRNYHAILASY